MANFNNAVTVNTNFITPPDILADKTHSVLLIDVLDFDVEELMTWTETADESYNIYLYNESMNNTEWLFTVAKQVDAVIVNLLPTKISELKKYIVNMEKSYHYGNNNNFAPSAISQCLPIEYFKRYEESIK